MHGWSRFKAAFRFKNSIRSRLSVIEREIQGSRATYVGNNRVLVKCVVNHRNIAYYVEADDRLLAPWFIISGEYETSLTDYCLANFRTDSHCIDVGANFGYFTCLMARFCPQGKVVGIEADAHVFEIVRDNIAINGFGHARAIHAAASDADGMLTLYRRLTRSGNTSIAAYDRNLTEALGEEPSVPFDVAAMRIDGLLDEFGGRVDLIKIDVEGAEPMALAGAEKTIEANPQLSIVMEWSPGQIRAAGLDVAGFLQSLRARNLRAFDLTDKGPVALSFDELANIPYRGGVVLKR